MGWKGLGVSWDVTRFGFCFVNGKWVQLRGSVLSVVIISSPDIKTQTSGTPPAKAIYSFQERKTPYHPSAKSRETRKPPSMHIHSNNHYLPLANRMREYLRRQIRKQLPTPSVSRGPATNPTAKHTTGKTTLRTLALSPCGSS